SLGSRLPPSLTHSLSIVHFTTPATTVTYTLSLHDALPILSGHITKTIDGKDWNFRLTTSEMVALERSLRQNPMEILSQMQSGKLDRKSTRLNSSHVSISYAVFCLKKKRKTSTDASTQSLSH